MLSLLRTARRAALSQRPIAIQNEHAQTYCRASLYKSSGHYRSHRHAPNLPIQTNSAIYPAMEPGEVVVIRDCPPGWHKLGEGGLRSGSLVARRWAPPGVPDEPAPSRPAAGWRAGWRARSGRPTTTMVGTGQRSRQSLAQGVRENVDRPSANCQVLQQERARMHQRGRGESEAQMGVRGGGPLVPSAGTGVVVGGLAIASARMRHVRVCHEEHKTWKEVGHGSAKFRAEVNAVGKWPSPRSSRSGH